MSRSRPLTRRRRVARWALALSLLLGLVLGLAATYRRSTGNLGTVEPGRVYRSAQLSTRQLDHIVREKQIRTVLNLRGPNPDEAWYQGEVRTTLASGTSHVSIPLASDQWLSHEQVRTLLETLDTIEYPVLIHCEFGAERTGLVSAVAALLREGSTIEDGKDQFSLTYLFLPYKDGLVMRGHVLKYEQWLRTRKLRHSPAMLRYWLTNAYEPSSPSREYWPCDPYPRKVVWRAGAGEGGRPQFAEDWSEQACPNARADRVPEQETLMR